MKKLNIYLVIAGFILAFTSCKNPEVGGSSPCITTFTDSSDSHPKAATYQNLIDHYTQAGIPGITLLIKDNNGLWIGSSGKADIENNVDMAPCTVSKVASITKMFMGTLTLMLVDEGVLDLDAKISTYLPADMVDKIANADEATLRQIMNHTSGIYDVVSDQGFYLDLLNNPEQHWTQESILEHVYGKDAAFPCGTDQGYSNTNYLLISLILEEATGKKHYDLLHERIIDPLNLQNTYYFYHDALPAYTAQGYYDLYNNGNIMNLTNYNTGSGNGYTGLYMDVRDLQLFIEGLFVNKVLLSDSMLNIMQTFTDVDPENGRAFGLGIYKDFLNGAPDEYGLGHRGRDLAYSADAFYFPKNGTVMAFIINYGTNGNSAVGDLFFEFRDELEVEIFN